MFEFITRAIDSIFHRKPEQVQAPAPPAVDTAPHGPVAAGTGQAPADGSLQKVFGGYADGPAAAGRDGRDKERKKLMSDNDDNVGKVAAKMIDKEYGDSSNVDVNVERKLGKLDTKEARLAAMSQLTQNDPAISNSEHLCGPTALVGAALYAQGNQGMETLMEQMEAGQKKGAKPDVEFTELRKKLAKGDELNVSDTQMMQAHLYSFLRKKQLATLGEKANEEAGIDGKVMQDFIKNSPDMAKMFADSKMNMSQIDNTGDGKEKHFVLNIKDDARAMPSSSTMFNTVYDPYIRKGGQIVTESDQVRDYDNTRKIPLLNYAT